MTWHILGAGSLGALWACRLAGAGLPTRIILRNQTKFDRYQQAQGLTLKRQDQSTRYAIEAELPTHAAPIQRLLVTCKAYDAAEAVAAVRDRLTSNAQVLLLQNGMGSQAEVKAQAPWVTCILGSSTEGAYRPAEFVVVPAGLGQNFLGTSEHAAPPAWLAELGQAGIPHQWSQDIEMRLWRKLALNCAINPLTVLHDCRNGELLSHVSQLKVICDELSAILINSAQGAAAAGLYEQVLEVVQATAANYSSMHQDVSARRRTEISYLLGFAVTTAQQQALQIPQLAALYRSLQAYLKERGLPLT